MTLDAVVNYSAFGFHFLLITGKVGGCSSYMYMTEVYILVYFVVEPNWDHVIWSFYTQFGRFIQCIPYFQIKFPGFEGILQI